MGSRRRRWLRWFGIAAVIVVVVGIPTAWLALRRIPSWYRPLELSPTEIDRVRDDLTAKFAEISDGIARGLPFQCTLSGRQINEWLMARSGIWPDSGDWVPPWLRDPVVVLQPGRVVFGGHLDYERWEAILAARFSAAIDGRDVVLRLASASVGAVPIPTALLAGPLDAIVHSDALHSTELPAEVLNAVRYLRQGSAAKLLTDGLRLSGPFIWENGKRPFAVDDVQIEDDRLTVFLRPLRE